MWQQHFLTLTKDFMTYANVFQEKAALNQPCFQEKCYFSVKVLRFRISSSLSHCKTEISENGTIFLFTDVTGVTLFDESFDEFFDEFFYDFLQSV